MLRLALEGSILERSPLRVRMLPGENQRDRVLTDDEEARHFQATISVGGAIVAAHAKAVALA